MSKTPCKDGCIMCGTCCVCYTIEDKEANFFKPSYTKCEHLVYKGKRALCELHGTSKKPQACIDYAAEAGFRRMWFAQRLGVYKRRDHVEHMLWCLKHGYLDHLKVIQDIRTWNYDSADEVFRYFIVPYLSNVPDTVAAKKGLDWFRLWGLTDYLKNMPADVEEKILELAQTRCKGIYGRERTKKLGLPDHVLEVFQSALEKYPHGRWLPRLHHALWG